MTIAEPAQAPSEEWVVVIGKLNSYFYRITHNGHTWREGCPGTLEKLGEYLTRAISSLLSTSNEKARNELGKEVRSIVKSLERDYASIPDMRYNEALMDINYKLDDLLEGEL